VLKLRFRQKALTPLIAGSVCGGLMGIAWIIGFTWYFIKRYRKKKLAAAVAAGLAEPKIKPPKGPQEKLIIPPDPAIVLGHRVPGETAFKGENEPEKEADLQRKEGSLREVAEADGEKSDDSRSSGAQTRDASDAISVEMTVPRNV